MPPLPAAPLVGKQLLLHYAYLVDKLIETGHMETGAVTEKRKFLANEANATRIAGIVQAGLPIVTAVIVTGARIMISRGASRV